THRGDVAAQEPDEVATDRQPEARASVLSRATAVDLPEFLENQVDRVRGDTDSGVTDREHHPSPFCPSAHGDAPGLGELDGVAQQIDQNLFELALVGDQTRQVCIHGLDQSNLLGPHHGLDGPEALVDDGLDVDGGKAHIRVSRLYLREIEDVVDELQ